MCFCVSLLSDALLLNTQLEKQSVSNFQLVRNRVMRTAVTHPNNAFARAKKLRIATVLTDKATRFQEVESAMNILTAMWQVSLRSL